MTENDMTCLLLKLADLGVTGIKIFYEGGGDSGCIEESLFTTDKLSENEDKAFDMINSIEPWDSDIRHLSVLDSGLDSDIKNFAVDEILNNIEDWWNNEGGSGTMCIMVPSGKYKVENNIRITEVETFNHDGNLINKTLE